ncbi:head maturation protease, ClpP-related [Ureibacillus thermosphaericus]|uniref:ATP-dependent Clp protease proteolytic subunit n=1 Tax=Ureibacillus thermosphaericus TaxID=51173 RepID=A0A840PQ76_URETH|nr:head maturation protease, ClpP-related [Ureibacillus thermosphaericus]MBB5148649.1 ATP-dependent Clp endopeptidase proteolytic subunit ClpP [Ureibacillus thermosphaericus]NKZ31364.1 Clp protease ClpP [Ureibacillus thermosphaericus]
MKIEIKGPIIPDSHQWVYDLFRIPATSPSKVSRVVENAIRNNVKELNVVINSGGGSVFSASEIYTELKKFAGNVKVEIVGVAASAASVIAMAGTHIAMAPTSQLMIHNAMNSAEGDYRVMNHNSDFLQKVNRSIMNAYISKTGKTVDELKQLMDAETWMTAQEAKEAGFIDEIMFESEVGAVASMNIPELSGGMLPEEVINRMRELLASQEKGISVVNSVGVQQNIKEGVNKKMDLQELKNQYPELVEQIKNEAKEEAIAAERKRIQEIENIAVPGAEEIINKAKFETGATAGEVAVEILKNDALKKSMMLQNIKEDAQIINEVEANALPQSKDEEVDALINKVLGGK